jgi:predicted ATPase
LREALRARELLMVLDNCEHLLDACAGLAEALLHACPCLRILATSREPLGLAGETRWRVPSLSLPPPDQAASPEAVAQCEAVQLFVERARAVQPPFALSAANAAAVAEVCARLDGIPLALELAAARLSGLGLAELAARLDQRFRLLTGGSRTVLPRQQTLRATVAWSYDLLTPPEQALFARLAVFAGGWSLEAAEAVGAGDPIAVEEVLDLLARLVDKSLVLAEELEDGGMRYRLLEALRQYGQERLAAAAETAPVRRRHAAYYLELAERFAQVIAGPEHQRWLDRLEREFENLRAALTLCLEAGEPAQGPDAVPAGESALRLAIALHAFWRDHDHRREGLAWLERALAQGAAAPVALRVSASRSAGVLAPAMNDDLARTRAFLAESVALCLTLGDPRHLSLSLATSGWALASSGHEAEAAAALDESLALARTAGESHCIAHALFHDLLRIVYGDAIARRGARPRQGGGRGVHPALPGQRRDPTCRPGADAPGASRPV